LGQKSLHSHPAKTTRHEKTLLRSRQTQVRYFNVKLGWIRLG
jgi:hypothetical protein